MVHGCSWLGKDRREIKTESTQLVLQFMCNRQSGNSSLVLGESKDLIVLVYFLENHKASTNLIQLTPWLETQQTGNMTAWKRSLSLINSLDCNRACIVIEFCYWSQSVWLCIKRPWKMVEEIAKVVVGIFSLFFLYLVDSPSC